jgi:hypothetical protein
MEAFKDIKAERRQQVIENLAKVLAGLQVPYSIGRRILGTAAEPWSELQRQLHMIGWNDSEQYKTALEEVLK